jgi:hypothetical protein
MVCVDSLPSRLCLMHVRQGMLTDTRMGWPKAEEVHLGENLSQDSVAHEAAEVKGQAGAGLAPRNTASEFGFCKPYGGALRRSHCQCLMSSPFMQGRVRSSLLN